VGTFYRSPGPNQEPFVQEGKTVSAGDTLCIVEAMKLMNEIESDVKGRILKVLVKDGTPVEFGEALFEIEKI
jgi:acetyl-CoA carboxylase biotin carboxyl carrier protein